MSRDQDKILWNTDFELRFLDQIGTCSGFMDRLSRFYQVKNTNLVKIKLLINYLMAMQLRSKFENLNPSKISTHVNRLVIKLSKDIDNSNEPMKCITCNWRGSLPFDITGYSEDSIMDMGSNIQFMPCCPNCNSNKLVFVFPEKVFF